MDFAEQFCIAMDETGLSIADIAEVIDVSQPTVRRWRTGDVVPHENLQPRFLSLLKKLSSGATMWRQRALAAERELALYRALKICPSCGRNDSACICAGSL